MRERKEEMTHKTAAQIDPPLPLSPTLYAIDPMRAIMDRMVNPISTTSHTMSKIPTTKKKIR